MANFILELHPVNPNISCHWKRSNYKCIIIIIAIVIMSFISTFLSLQWEPQNSTFVPLSSIYNPHKNSVRLIRLRVCPRSLSKLSWHSNNFNLPLQILVLHFNYYTTLTLRQQLIFTYKPDFMKPQNSLMDLAWLISDIIHLTTFLQTHTETSDKLAPPEFVAVP